MATGGYDITTDSRKTCTICLEPYKGRHPKLLPCFHTFCSPCLTQMAEKERRSRLGSQKTGGDGDEGDKHGDGDTGSITCPICRASIPLPPSGVMGLHRNVYLDDDSSDPYASAPRPLLCDLCEEGQEAKFTCGSCKSYFCGRCRKPHNRFCEASGVREVGSPAVSIGSEVTSGGSAGESSESGIIEMLEEVVKTLTSEEKRLTQERREREHDIHVRHATLLRHISEARDASLLSLREVTQVLGDVMQADLALAREALKKLKKEKSGSAVPRGSSEEILPQEKRRHFEEMLRRKRNEDEGINREGGGGGGGGKEDENALLRYSASDKNVDTLLRYVNDFMGLVVASGQEINPLPLHDVSSAAAVDEVLLENLSDTADLSKDGGNVLGRVMKKQVETEKLVAAQQSQITALLNQNNLLCKELASIQDKTTNQAAELSSLKSESASLKTDTSSLRTDVTSLKTSGKKDHDAVERELSAFRDKTSIICQDNQQLKNDVTAVQNDVSKTQTDFYQLQSVVTQTQTDLAGLQTASSKVQTDASKFQTDVIKFANDVAKVTTDVAKVTADVTKVTTDVAKVTTDVTKVTTDVTKVKTDVANVTTDVTRIKTDFAKVTTDVTKVKTDVAKVMTDVTQIKTDVTKVKTDVAKVTTDIKIQGDVSQIQNDARKLQTVQTAVDSIQKEISLLQTNQGKMSAQVAFQATLTVDVTLTKSHVLICDNVVASTGGGYDSSTGLFTVPVSGVYCILATSTPWADDMATFCSLFIVADTEHLAFLAGYGKTRGTAHASVHLGKGQKVFLRAGDNCSFKAGPFKTSFCGHLVQPDL